MVLTRNSCMSENFRASKRILRDIKHKQNLRPRISNPNYREESPDEIAYYHNILKVNVKNKKSLSHKLRIRSDNAKNSYKEIHRYELRTTTHGDTSDVNHSVDCAATSVHDSDSKSENKRLDRDPIGNEARIIRTPVPSINESNTIFDNSNKKTSVFGVNKCKTAFKRRLSNSFTKHSDLDTSQICYDNGRRYPIRLRRRPPDVYMVNTGYKSVKKPNWHDSMSSPLQSNFDSGRHRKLELYSKQSDTDSSDDSLKDEIRFENRKQRSMQRARSELNPINMSGKELTMDLVHERNLARSSLADIEPMAIDKTINFTMIAGNQGCIQALKESVILPLVYPEVFEKLNISPPRGLLFYGAPGSGKTLMARALVNECSDSGDRKIAFFMRKGADCLSKWVGESERQLRLLFDQAYRMRPSIIFFDEIDGLAPVRSARQDQIHSSIVSTLLSLIDGLDDRGDIIVIGATNRLDAIDPALRRPGRFDREFLFTLPEESDRRDIIRIHTRKWDHRPTESLVDELASVTKGYSGADIKGLVIEAGLCALRRRYPQIYSSHKKLQLNMNEIYVKEQDFKKALTSVRPSNERSTAPIHSKIHQRLHTLIDRQYSCLKMRVSQLFQQSVFVKDQGDHIESSPSSLPNLFKQRLLVTGYEVDHLVAGLFHDIHNVTISCLDSLFLGATTGLSVEEKLSHLFREAHKSGRSIIYLPHIDMSFHGMSLGAQHLLLSLVKASVPNADFKLTNVLILATLSSGNGQWQWSEVEFDHPQSESVWTQLGECFRGCTVTIDSPSIDQRMAYFYQLRQCVRSSCVNMAGTQDVTKEKEVLKEVEITPKTLTKVELDKLEVEEDNILRKFRMLLRKMLASLAKERKFQVFHNPVDETEVPDYYNIVTNPMDLGTMRQKVDLYNYNTFEELKQDLHLISANALLYNPPKSSYLKDIRRHAYEFNDIADSIFEEHLNADFAKLVADIHQSRVKRNYYEKKKQALAGQSGEMHNFLADLNGTKYPVTSGPLLASQMDSFKAIYGQSGASGGCGGHLRAHSDSEAATGPGRPLVPVTVCGKSKSLSEIDGVVVDQVNGVTGPCGVGPVLEDFDTGCGDGPGEEETMEVEEECGAMTTIEEEEIEVVVRRAAEASCGLGLVAMEALFVGMYQVIWPQRDDRQISSMAMDLLAVVDSVLSGLART